MADVGEAKLWLYFYNQNENFYVAQNAVRSENLISCQTWVSVIVREAPHGWMLSGAVCSSSNGGNNARGLHIDCRGLAKGDLLLCFSICLVDFSWESQCWANNAAATTSTVGLVSKFSVLWLEARLTRDPADAVFFTVGPFTYKLDSEEIVRVHWQGLWMISSAPAAYRLSSETT